jgi:hypothetical protein
MTILRNVRWPLHGSVTLTGKRQDRGTKLAGEAGDSLRRIVSELETTKADEKPMIETCGHLSPGASKRRKPKS